MSKGTNDQLEQDRYQVEGAEIVVHGAKIICDCAGEGKHPNYISVLDGHGILEDGNNCAHDAACVPLKNIMPFPSCASPNVGKALAELVKNAGTDAKARYSTALIIYTGNATSYTYSPVPCTLPLLERWFDAEEKEIVTDSMNMDYEVKQMIQTLNSHMKSSMKKAVVDTYAAFLLALYNPKLSLDEKGVYSKKNEALKELKNKIETLCSNTATEINTKIQPTGIDFKPIINELEDSKKNMNQIAALWDDAYKVYPGLINYQAYKNELKSSIEKIDEVIKDVNNWKEKEYHLITTKSFLVCRCGGIISFLDSGQSYGKVVDELQSSLLTMITEFKEHCMLGMEMFSLKELDGLDHAWSSYENAAKGLEYMEGMLFGQEGEREEGTASIYIELVCHSFNSEISKRMMSMLSLISLKVNVLAYALAFYTLTDFGEGAQGVVDWISAEISAFEAVSDETGGVITALGGGAIVQCNNLYTILTSITNFFYVSYDTWIENIKITVFTDSHAHVSERKVMKDGTLEKGEYIQMYTKSDFIAGNLGRGLKWNEDPGVYMKNLMHIGNQNDEGKKIDKEDEIQSAVPHF